MDTTNNELQDKFQIEVTYKEGVTKEEQEALATFIKDTLDSVHESEGTDEAFPACVDALTIRRTPPTI